MVPNYSFISRWDGILSGRFTGLRGANDLREIPYVKPIKVYSKKIKEFLRVNFFQFFISGGIHMTMNGFVPLLLLKVRNRQQSMPKKKINMLSDFNSWRGHKVCEHRQYFDDERKRY